MMNKLNVTQATAVLLALSSGLLTVLVPGGPIETRSFAHINPLILGGFNTVLTTLSLVSLLLIYFVLKGQRWALRGATLCGLTYFVVYGLDLAHLFPVSPDAMPVALLVIEVLGTIVSLPLMVVAMKGVELKNEDSRTSGHTQGGEMAMVMSQVQQGAIALLFLLVGLGIIVFATRSAMGL